MRDQESMERLLEKISRISEDTTPPSFKQDDELATPTFDQVLQNLRSAIKEKVGTLESRNRDLESRIAELEQRERDHKREQELANKIFESSEAAVAVGDVNSIIRRVNKAFTRMFGYTREEAIGQHIDRLITPDESLHQALSLRQRLVSSGNRVRTNTIRQHKDGSLVYVSVLVTPFVVDGERSGAVAIYQDVTRRVREEMEEYQKDLEQISQHRQEKLKQAQQAILDGHYKSELADIATGTLHNVKNILGSIRVSSQIASEILENQSVVGFKKALGMLKDNLDTIDEFVSSDPKGKVLMQYLANVGGILENIIEESKSHMTRMIDQIEIIEKIVDTQQAYGGPAQMEDVDLCEILDDVLTMQEVAIDSFGIRIRNTYDDVPHVFGHKAKLVHVLVNVFKNALEAMRGTPKSERMLTISIRADTTSVYMEMADTGAGIKTEDAHRIFDHGFTTKENGHGFGLHSCLMYMREMGGDLRLVSEGPGTGTTAIMEFPKK